MASTTGFRRGRLAASAVVVAGLALAACGTSSSSSSPPSNPVLAVHDSVSGLTKQSGLGVKFSLGIDAAQLQQLVQMEKSSTPISSAEAQAITTGSLLFEVSTGHGEALHSSQAATDSSNNFDFGVTLGTDTPIEFRAVAQNIFLHLQIQKLLSDTGQSSSSASKLQGEASSVDQYVPGLSSFLDGNWAEMTHAGLAPLLGDLKGLEAAQGVSSSTANENQYKGDFTKLSRDIAAALKTNSTTTKVGTSNGQTEYNVTVQVKPFVQQVGTALQTDLASLPAGVGTKYASGVNAATAKIPAGQTVVLQVFSEDNKLSEVDVDINQFAPAGHKAPFAVPVKMVIIDNPTISAPNGATVLDLSKLPSLLSGLTGGAK